MPEKMGEMKSAACSWPRKSAVVNIGRQPNRVVRDAITRSVNDKFNCITVNFDRTWNGIYKHD